MKTIVVFRNGLNPVLTGSCYRGMRVRLVTCYRTSFVRSGVEPALTPRDYLVHEHTVRVLVFSRLTFSRPIHFRDLTCSRPTLSLPVHIRYLTFSLPVLFATRILSQNNRYQQKYSEKSENIIGLDSYILNSFSYLSPI